MVLHSRDATIYTRPPLLLLLRSSKEEEENLHKSRLLVQGQIRVIATFLKWLQIIVLAPQRLLRGVYPALMLALLNFRSYQPALMSVTLTVTTNKDPDRDICFLLILTSLSSA